MNIVDITLDNAKQFLIDESFIRHVVIEFWAEHSKNLTPTLEKLAHEFNGRFLLAKVNTNELATISSQFSVRSVPTVIVMKEGQPIDGFTGALPEIQVR